MISELRHANALRFNHVPLVETTRGNAVENMHFGSVAVVDAAGRLLHSAGDPDWVTFSRSTIKPFQATPFVTDGGMAHFGLTLQEVALLCSSHSGEAFHLETAASILAKAENSEADLQCGCHEPMMFSVLGKTPEFGMKWRSLHNNCSGKHAGFLAWCKLNDKLTANYLAMEHPLQQAIRRSLSIWCDEKPENFVAGIDGCSAPNYALSLRKLATGYARLASNKGGGTAKTLFDAMTLHPEYVSGTARHDLAFMQEGKGDWVAKIGADGVQVIGVRSAGIGIAIKVIDGNQRAVIAAAVSTLSQLGLIKDVSQSLLADWAQPEIVNVAGKLTGVVRAVFKLQD
jgi:L-asparaginase II